jgi:hypothetical protein
MRTFQWAARLMLPLAVTSLVILPSLQAQTRTSNAPSTEFPFGGVHELGGYVGHSWQAGPALGYVRNTTFTTVVARYSYRLVGFHSWDLRYAPELTLLADLYEHAPSPGNIHTGVPLRDLGGGISPVALQAVFLKRHRFQPFVSATGGMLYYNHPVLADGATAFMFTVDLGAGMNVFVTPRVATTVGFRYQHQSNANVGMHNPGTDAELFYVGLSHFHTKGSR